MKIGRVVKDSGGGYHLGVCILFKAPEERTPEFQEKMVEKLFEVFPEATLADHDHYLVHSRSDLNI
ncbi:hypothetical protein ACFL1X_08410 [Candidatus Hydrogenedentota bacterium]